MVNTARMQQRLKMTKTELIEAIDKKQPFLNFKDVAVAVNCIVEQMSQALANGERIEVRGFGSFSLHHRPPRMGRNPSTGEVISLTSKYAAHFKPGKELREKVNLQK